MARPELHSSVEQQQRIVEAIRRLDIVFPRDNVVFLDKVIEAAQAVTRRVYDVRRYVQWLGEAGVRRRPSNTTLQKAVDRAQGHGPAAAGAAADAVELWPLPLTYAEAGTPSAREERNRIASRAIGAPGAGVEWMEARIRAEVVERALEHEAARNRQLQAAMADLERHLGEVLATAPAVPLRLTDATLERLEQAIGTMTRLEGVASTLVGMERFLRLQNDAIRQQTQNEVDRLHQRIRTLEAEVAHLNAQIDAYRRMLERTAPVSRGWVKPSS